MVHPFNEWIFGSLYGGDSNGEDALARVRGIMNRPAKLRAATAGGPTAPITLLQDSAAFFGNNRSQYCNVTRSLCGSGTPQSAATQASLPLA